MNRIYTEVEKNVADIRNKLSPFWNLVAIVRTKDYPQDILIDIANIANDNQVAILQNLQNILRLVDPAIGYHRVYGEPISKFKFCDIMSIDEWREATAEYQYITPNDGFGYWVKDNMSSCDDVFETEQYDATQVIWFNK